MQFSADYFEKKIICAKLFSTENIQQDDERSLFLLLIHIFFSFPSDLVQTLLFSTIASNCLKIAADDASLSVLHDAKLICEYKIRILS